MSYVVKRLITTSDIQDGAITQDKLAQGLSLGLSFVPVIVPIPDSTQNNLPADSGGCPWISNYYIKIYKTNLQKIRIRASWSSSATDNVIKIELYDDDADTSIVSVSGNSGDNVEAEVTDLSSISDGDYAYVDACVETVSSTSGATFSIDYVIVELIYGVS